jgi:hypothetical protein
MRKSELDADIQKSFSAASSKSRFAVSRGSGRRNSLPTFKEAIAQTSTQKKIEATVDISFIRAFFESFIFSLLSFL